MKRAYYNEIDGYCAQWLRNLMAEGLIPEGEVDERSIAEVQPSDLDDFGQCHFFAGLGGWAYAARLAGLADDFPLWTGSCPCQPFSVAGRGRGADDERHLWPEFYRLIRECRPAVVFGEQVAGKAGLGWLDGVFADLEGSGYACGAAVVPACGVGAPHRRERLWFVADARRERGQRWPSQQRPNIPRAAIGNEEGTDDQRGGRSGPLGDANGAGPQEPAGERGDAREERTASVGTSGGGFWGDALWLAGADGKSRRVGPGLRLLAHGIPARVAKLRALGNAIVPQVAAQFIVASLRAA